MTLLDLQSELIKKIEEILKDIHFLNCEKQSQKIKGYAQTAPRRLAQIKEPRMYDYQAEDYEKYYEAETDPQKELVPFFVVRITEANFSNEENKAIIDILFQIFDDDMNMKGYFTLFASMERIRQHFSKNNVLGAYWCEDKFSIVSQENDTYPYFYGGIEMIWNLPKIEREGFFDEREN